MRAMAEAVDDSRSHKDPQNASNGEECQYDKFGGVFLFLSMVGQKFQLVFLTTLFMTF